MDILNLEYSTIEENFKLAMINLHQEALLINYINNEILNESISDKIKSLKEKVISFFKVIRDKLKEIFDVFKDKIKDIRNKYHKNKILSKISKLNESTNYFNESLKVSDIKFPQVYKDAANFFDKYNGDEIEFGKLSMDFIEGKVSDNLKTCFKYIKEDIMKCVQKPNSIDDNILIDKIKDTKTKIVKDAIYYMIPKDKIGFSENNIKDKIVKYWSDENNNNTKMITSNSDINNGFLIREMIRIISGTGLEDEFVNLQYKQFMNDINEYEKKAYEILDSKNQSYLSNFLSLVESATSIGFQVNSAVVQLYSKLISQCDNILTNMVVYYAKLYK